MDFRIAVTTAQCLRNHPDSAVIDTMQHLTKVVIVKLREIVGKKTVDMLLEGTDRLHEAALEVIRDSHHLAGRLHLRTKQMLSCNELIERETRHLHDAIVKHRLEGRIRFPGDCIFNLIQCVAERDLRRHLRNRIAGRL